MFLLECIGFKVTLTCSLKDSEDKMMRYFQLSLLEIYRMKYLNYLDVQFFCFFFQLSEKAKNFHLTTGSVIQEVFDCNRSSSSPAAHNAMQRKPTTNAVNTL